jgi:hypothetical protein
MKSKSSLSFGILFVFLIQTITPISVIAQNNDRDLNISSFPRKAKRFALVIGVDEYQDKQITKLEGATNDAKMLADTLIQYCGFPADQVTTLTLDQPPERRPTRANILGKLSALSSNIPKDGLLLVSFSGHGIERDGQAFLLPTDAQLNGGLGLLEQTAINAEVIKKWIRDMGISQVLMILDACRNNPSAGRGDESKSLTANYTHKFNFDLRNKEVNAFATLYATDVGQVAYEYIEKKQGYFTWALVEGLKGGAADENGEVTLAKLVKYLQEAVPKRMKIDFGDTKNQKPFAIIEGYKADDLVIAVTGKGQIATLAPAPQAPAIQTVDSSAIELSFWDTIKSSTNPEDFKAYLQQYPNGRFAPLAKIRAIPTTPNQPSSATGPGDNTRPPDPNAIVTKDISSLRVALKSIRRVKLAGDTYGSSKNGIRCSFEFINLETQKPIVVAMNATVPDQGINSGSASIGSYLRSTLIDENGGLWRLLNSDVGGMTVIGVGQQRYPGPYYNPAEIVTALSRRDDSDSDVSRYTYGNSEGEYRFIFGSTTEMSPGQSLTVTMTFIQDTNRTTSDALPKVFQMVTEIVVGIAKTGAKKSYTLYNLTFERVSL